MNTTASGEKVVVYDVFTLSDLYLGSLHSAFDNTSITLQGFYYDNKGKMYGNDLYYDYLHDKKDNRITLRLNSDIKAALQHGAFYQLCGYVNRSKSFKDTSSISLLFHVTKIEKHEKDVQLISEKEYDIIKQRYDSGLFDVESFLLGKLIDEEHPSILIVTGNESVVMGDLLDQLGYDQSRYQLSEKRVNLTSQAEIRELLETESSYDLLAIVRGGGSGLGIFNELELCRFIIEKGVPFITAIGHESDRTLLEKVADKSFATPTSLGAFLKNIVRTHEDRNDEIYERERAIEVLEQNMTAKVEGLEQLLRKDKKEMNLWRLAAILLAFLVMYMFYFVLL
ncbi:hypothetical protein GCM10009122_23110 [Fulvivirga kasyanovii]|uniref:Exonuclease VII large subunit C-terminal domain-containing protein n=1 Tax=Fulvivirga kasyanovii TaxID=396812 RepID=A0ABW9RXL6_9BACT|nr:exodeoxyribonuclease VII large subunit [Fulvivirga kasyanovii]MTI28982.1 hypothetical protein [Fulvivirga kasyanovii]